MMPSKRLLFLWALGLVPALLVPFSSSIFLVVLLYDVLLLLAFLLDAIWLRSSRQLKIDRAVPTALTTDFTSEIVLRAHNPTGHRYQLEIKDHIPPECRAEPTSLTLSLSDEKPESVVYDLRPLQRGDVCFGPIEARITSPLGLAVRQQRWLQDDPLMRPVFPQLQARRRAKTRQRPQKMQRQGARRLRHKGKGTEFAQMREYTPDDEFRDINWKATAKRGVPITQVYQAERSQNIFVVLDYGRLMGASIKDRTKLDVAIETTLQLFQTAQDFDDRFGLLLFSHKPEHFIPPKKGMKHFQRIRRLLYKLDPLSYNVQYQEMFAFLRTRHRKRSLVIFLTDLGDQDTAEQLARYVPLLQPTHLPLCISIADPMLAQRASMPITEDFDLYRRTAAQEMLSEQQQLLRMLQRKGVLTLHAPPSQISPNAVEQYLHVKARHLL